jgi:hypothetical protein
LEEIGFGAHKKSKFDKCNIIQYMTSKRDIWESDNDKVTIHNGKCDKRVMLAKQIEKRKHYIWKRGLYRIIILCMYI